MVSYNLKQYMPKEAVKIDDRYFLDFISEDNDCIYQGTYLGEDVFGEFIPSLAFIKHLESIEEIGEIVVNNRNEWLFSCGKPITDVVKDTSGKLLIVKNGYNEIIGIATRETNRFYNVWDVGHLLRRELN